MRDISDNLPIVLQALTRFDSAYASTALQLAKRWARTRPVLYVDHPFTLKDILKGWRRADIQRRLPLWREGAVSFKPFPELPDFTVVVPPPVIPFNALPEGRLFRALSGRAIRTTTAAVTRALQAQGIRRYVYINYLDPVYAHPPADPRPELTVYHCVDNISGAGYIARHGEREEIRFASEAGLVVATSRALTGKMKDLNPNSVFIPNAADFDLFSNPNKKNIPEEVRNDSSLKLLYCGSVGMRLDCGLLEALMKRHPEWTLYMVGPVDAAHFTGAALQRLPNVVFTGGRPYHELPAWVSAADVCLIPFEHSELTRFIYPLKINEYLAGGKPVVATGFADLSDFERVIAVADGLEAFEAAIQREASTHSPERAEARKALAASNTWDDRLERFNRALSESLQQSRINSAA